ncbi:MAG: hypothetical protein IJZ86_04210 [Bacteroides sp.]|nr:hypothetical protein [Bacteroides sp.]
MKKVILFIIALAIVFSYFCCESSPSMESLQQTSEVQTAKKFLTNLNCNVSFPAHPKGATTRSVAYSTEAIPDWDNSYTKWTGDEQTVIIPLLGEDEIRSRATFTLGNEKSYQFAKTFSRLVIRTKGEQTVAHIITYLPESEYAEAHSNLLKPINFNLKEVGFNGIVIVSSLNGNIMHTLIYKEGEITNKLIPASKHIHTTACTHKHSNSLKLSIYFYSSEKGAMTRGGYDDGGEIDYCEQCWLPISECACWDFDEEDEDKPNPDECIRCGNDPCTCGFSACIYCGATPCVCYLDPDYCSICGTSPCSCSGHD